MVQLTHLKNTGIIVAALCTGLMLSACCPPVIVAAGASGAIVSTDRRSSGTIVDDKTIEMKAFHALNINKDMKKTHITVVSYNNVLLLVGQAPTEALRAEAEHIVADIPKVRTVYNEITVGAPINYKQRSMDTWITTQMKSRLLSTPLVKPTQVKVITENGTLYLMGLLTEPEEEETVRLAKQIKHVRSIVKMFETVHK